MFGIYSVPLTIEKEGVSLHAEREGENISYRRECAGEKVEKFLLTSNGKLIINPVEPLNIPKEITIALMIEFETTVLIGPKTTRRLFLKFPVELGVFVSEKNSFEILDIFTLTKTKFTLYGDPKNGVLCRYWKSDISFTVPKTDLIHEGVLELDIINTSHKWIEVSKAVFNAFGMKIYYKDSLVSMKANMRVSSDELAETDFEDSPVEGGMMKSIELYLVKKIPVLTTKFVMEWGI